MQAVFGGGFGAFHLSSVKPPFWIRCRRGELGRECDARISEGVDFLSPSHWLGKLFTLPQLSTVFLIQDGGLNVRQNPPALQANQNTVLVTQGV